MVKKYEVKFFYGFRFCNVIFPTRVRQRAESWNEIWWSLILKVCDSQGCRPTTPDAPSYGMMKSNETKWMRWAWRKWWNEICGKRKQEKPQEKLTQTPFVLHETHVEWPRREVGILEACATESPSILYYFQKLKKIFGANLYACVWLNVCVLVRVCVWTSLNVAPKRLMDLVQILYVESFQEHHEPFLVAYLRINLRVVHIRKNRLATMLPLDHSGSLH